MRKIILSTSSNIKVVNEKYRCPLPAYRWFNFPDKDLSRGWAINLKDLHQETAIKISVAFESGSVFMNG